MKKDITIEEIVEEFDHRSYPCLKGNTQTNKERIEAHYRCCDWFEEILTQERQRCDEMVETLIRVVAEVDNYANPKTSNDCVDEMKIIAKKYGTALTHPNNPN